MYKAPPRPQSDLENQISKNSPHPKQRPRSKTKKQFWPTSLRGSGGFPAKGPIPSAYSNSEAEIYPTNTPSLTIQNPPSRPPIPFNHSTLSLSTRALMSFPSCILTSMQFLGSSDCGVHRSANVDVKRYRFLESRYGCWFKFITRS